MMSESSCSVPQTPISESSCVEEDDDDYEEAKPVISKKIKKEIDDRRFTIETTVTVQKSNKKDKSKKQKC